VNRDLNGLSSRIKATFGGPSKIRKSATLVICNMLVSELLNLRNDFARLTALGGTLICSGIISEQSGELRDSLSKAGFEYCVHISRENWVAVKFERF